MNAERKIAVVGRGAGKWRDRWEIRKQLDILGTNMKKEALKIGVHPVQFNETVNGLRNDRRVLAHLRELGCSDEALSLPEDMLQ